MTVERARRKNDDEPPRFEASPDALPVAAVVAAAGVAALFLPPNPTGAAATDGILMFLAAAAIAWAAATAPWSILCGACGVGASLTSDPAMLGVSLGAAAASLWFLARDRDAPWLRGLCAFAAFAALSTVGDVGAFGVSAVVGCAVLLLVALSGVRRRSVPVRRRAWITVASLTAAAVAAAAGAAGSGLAARASLEEGSEQARAGLAAVNAGDMDGAAAAFDAAAGAFSRADDALTRPWAQPSRLLPAIAQNKHVLDNLVAEAADTSRVAADALVAIDPDSVRVVQGHIDLAAVGALAEPFDRLAIALESLKRVATSANSPWIVEPVARRLDELKDDLARNDALLANARHAVDVAPELLGADGPRRYFIGFTTPAEARALGGFMGNWAEMTITEGRIEMSSFGRIDSLNLGGPDPDRRTLTVPARIARWANEVVAVDRTTGTVPWSNITKPPDFPSVATLVAELYPKSGGAPVDGVFLLDVEAVAALLTFTGPIDIPGISEPLTVENAVDYLLLKQYEVETPERVDLLERLARATLTQLLTTTLPSPPDVARLFGPLTREGRVLGWSVHADEQELLAEIGMSGAFPDLDNGDGLVVTIDNEAGNKIDTFLDIDAAYEARHDPATGALSSVLRVTLRNDAPTAGLPNYVIGNLVSLPKGTHRLRLSVFSAVPATATATDGDPAIVEFEQSFGWWLASQLVVVPPGAERTLTMTFDGHISPGPYTFRTRSQPVAGSLELRTSVTSL